MSNSMQTLLAVILGAILAAVGGFAATQVSIWIDRSRRARDAALLGGEILEGVGTLLRLAEEAALEGTFLDPVPFSLLNAARREIDVYDRNRELLFSLRNADLRVRVHSFVIRLSIPLDRLAGDRPRYIELCSRLPMPPRDTDELRQHMAATFEYLIKSRERIPELLALLRPLARNSFDSYSRIDRHGIPSDKSG
jgi:hypothetical protein